jgi:drug/metabolite transporter (DMT)-like permease
MNSILSAILIGIGLSAITVFADALVKQASLQKNFSGWHNLFFGGMIYGLTALGWFFVMRKMPLPKLVVLYAVSCVVLLTLVSVFFFKEKITPLEIFGVILAIFSLIILFRFA